MILKTRLDLESVGVRTWHCLLFLSVLVYDRDVAIAIITRVVL